MKLPFQRPYHHIYVEFGQVDEHTKSKEINEWVRERGHVVISTENIWCELLPHQTAHIHSVLLGKWYGLTKAGQKGMLNASLYDPAVLEEFKKVWGKK